MLTALITPLTNNILSLGAVLLIIALIVTITVRITINSWFAFILFLIYITGLLVLFRYIIAIRPNSYQTPKNKQKATLTIILILIIITMKTTAPTLVLESSRGKKTFEEEVIKLFEPVNTPMYWIIASTLLIALITAVTVCFKAAKPLRSFNP